MCEIDPALRAKTWDITCSTCKKKETFSVKVTAEEVLLQLLWTGWKIGKYSDRPHDLRKKYWCKECHG